MSESQQADHNPFHFSGPLPPGEMIDRLSEANELLALAEGGHSMLATIPGGPYTTAAQGQVGIKKSSVRYALQSLTDRADAIIGDDPPVLTDPLLELWLQRHAAV